jgi:hypothetical protein
MVNELKLGKNSSTNPKDIAVGFNDNFSNIGPNLDSRTCDLDVAGNYRLISVLPAINNKLWKKFCWINCTVVYVLFDKFRLLIR